VAALVEAQVSLVTYVGMLLLKPVYSFVAQWF